MNDSTWKYGNLKLSAMTYTFKCDNKECKKSIICLMSKYDDNEYFGKCQYCKSGRLKWVQNVDLKKILNDANIIHKNN